MQISNFHSQQSEQKPDHKPNGPGSQNKKRLLIKKKKFHGQAKLLHNIDIHHVINISDICYLNEDALRHSDITSESLLTSVYHYNMMSKVTLNKSYVSIELKKNNDNFLPPEYFIQRLRSFGDKQMAKVADNLQKIHYQFSAIKEACPLKETSFNPEKEELMLKNFLQARQGKPYFLFFSEISPQKITMRNIIFSVPLLEALGINVKNIAMDFVRYKHVFFEVFTAKNYRYFLQGCFENFSAIQAKVMENPNMDEDERIGLTRMVYEEEMVRKKPVEGGEYEELIPAKVSWFTPHPSICCFEILDMNESKMTELPKRIKPNESLQVYSDKAQTEISEKSNLSETHRKVMNGRQISKCSEPASLQNSTQSVNSG